jgi:lipopolysaccharide/colanic/teichoic acid biosynthesis glycosyltransferase
MARRRVVIGAALDLGGLLVALAFASLTVFDHPIPWVARTGTFPMLAAMVGGAIVGLVATARPAAATIPRPSYGRAMTATIVMLGVTATTILFLRPFWSRRFVFYATVVWLGIGLLQRFLRRRRPWAEQMVLISSEKTLIEHLIDEPHSDVVQVLDPGGEAPAAPPAAGTTLVVDLRAVLSDGMARFVSSVSLAGYPLRSLVGIYEEHTGRLPMVHLMEGWELTVPLNDRRIYVRLKRAIDTVLILGTSVAWVPLSLLIGVAVRIDSTGPAIYKQRRVGLDGHPFTLYKFRTMRVSSDDRPRFASKGDDRLTRFGRILRLTRMDELPQLWNALRGDLSLVGPRPEQERFVEGFTDSIPFYGHRHLVRPGITGWAQVNFGYADSEADTIEKLSYDLYYVKHVSMWMDLEILGRSIWTVLSGKGAR